jgi:cell wall-active antibiotic response 4TMS protein YvqF
MDAYQYNRACRCTRCRSRGIMWPVILITLGLLFLLDNLGVHGLGFDRTWPVILLVIGGVKLLQSNAPTDDHISPVLPLPAASTSSVPPGQMQPPSSEVRNV